MLSTFFEIIGTVVLGFLNFILSGFDLPYVNKMTDAIVWCVSMIATLNNQFPVWDLFACLTVLLLTVLFKYKINLFLHTIWPMIPFIGSRVDLPKIDGYDDMSQPYYQSVRGAPSNKNGMGTYYLYRRKKK